MRLFLFTYVILFLALNFFVEDDLVFILALSTFPVSVYLLLTKRKAKTKKQDPLHREHSSAPKIIEGREQNLHKH